MTAAAAGSRNPSRNAEGAYVFLLLACAITWACGVPFARAVVQQRTPGPGAMALAALSAFGPTIAAFALALSRKELGLVFGRWRTQPAWILLALASMPALNACATLIEVALGGRPAHWFYPPVKPEHVAALVLFSVGEEFGWRGFAYPRLARRHGPVMGAILLGIVWGLWHSVMWFTAAGPPSISNLALGIAHITCGSVIYAWVFERGNRSMAVAIALHASAHLDNVFRGPETELRLRLLRIAVMATAATFAARALTSRDASSSSS